MTASRQHQEAHGIGQIEKQLKRQAEATEELQGDDVPSDEFERFMADDPLTDRERKQR